MTKMMCALSCLECCLAIQGTVPEDPVEGSNSSNSRGEGGAAGFAHSSHLMNQSQHPLP